VRLLTRGAGRYRARAHGVVRAVLGGAPVVVATCHAAGGAQLRAQAFDVLVVDEATQAPEPVRAPRTPRRSPKR
jgi:superfamily I DNA and/or RNA helicase